MENDTLFILLSIITPAFALVATGLSIYNYLVGIWDRKLRKEKDNRELYYLPLSIQTKFADEFQMIYSNEGEPYWLKPLEMIFHRGFVKTARLFLTNLTGTFSVRKLSYTDEELAAFFKSKKTYSEPHSFAPSILLPVFDSGRVLVDIHFILIEGFSGDTELFMAFYVYDKQSHYMIAQEVFDKYHLVSTVNQRIIVDGISEQYQRDIDDAFSLAFADFKLLYEKLKNEI